MKNQKFYNIAKIALASFVMLGIEGANQQNKEANETTCAPLCFGGPFLDCDEGYDISAGVLYEQILAQAGEVASLTDRAQTFYPSNAVSVQQPANFGWGFMVGLGYKKLIDNWRAAFEYYNLTIINNASYGSAYGQQYLSSAYWNQWVENLNPLSTFGFANLDIGNKTTINDMDFILQRPTMLSPDLEMTTSYGINFTTLTRRQVAVLTNDSSATQVPLFGSLQGGFFQNYQKIMWYGVGPMVALHSVWKYWNTIGIFGDMEVGLQYGLSDCRTSTFAKRNIQSVTSRPVFFQPLEAVLQNKAFQFSPMVSGKVGAVWAETYKDEVIALKFEIAYDIVSYMNVMKVLTPDIAYRSENGAGIVRQGLFFSGAVDF
ncbi:MAG: hypothetical protein EB053_02640 [Chlamydiae bacterium]|nr:hypothetical protein [Chlamydiota bacterium]